MTPRECCKRLLNFKSAEYIPNYDSGLMSPHIQDEWRRQGLPLDQDYMVYFGINRRNVFKNAAYDPIPGVSDQGVIFEDDTRQVIRDSWGQETEWPKKVLGVA